MNETSLTQTAFAVLQNESLAGSAFRHHSGHESLKLIRQQLLQSSSPELLSAAVTS